MPDAAVQNTSTLVTDAEVAPWVDAINAQLVRDVRPFWGNIGAGNRFVLVSPGAPIGGVYRMILKDDPDVAGDLGFHIYANGIAESRIFVRPTLADGWHVSVVMSHEATESEVDPLTTRLAPDGAHLVEACDPVSADWYRDANGVWLANFVTPAYFRYNNDSRYDFAGKLKRPVDALLPGGYVMVYQDGGFVTKSMRDPSTGCLDRRVLNCGRSTFRARPRQ